MAFLFDNLTAFLVGAMLLVGLLFVQQRGQQSAIESTVRYRAEGQAASFVEMLARDLENARTQEQVRAAFGLREQVSALGLRDYALGLQGTAARTEWLTFATLADPEADAPWPLVMVAYRMIETGKTVVANGVRRPLYEIERRTWSGTGGWQVSGGSPPTVVDFTVRAEPGGADGVLADLPARIGVVVEMAFETPARQAGDQAETAEVGLTRQGATVRVYAAGTGGKALPPSQTTAPFIPRMPWEPAYTLPPPTTRLPSDPRTPTRTSGDSPGPTPVDGPSDGTGI